LVAKIICFFTLIGIGTSLTKPPNFKGNNKTSGEILIIDTKKIIKGSIHSICFNPYLICIKKLKAHNFLPQYIKD